MTRVLTYLFVRTIGTVNDNIEEFEHLLEDIVYNVDSAPSFLRFGYDGRIWSDGFSIRFLSDIPSSEIAVILDGALEKFSSWTIYKSLSDFHEKPAGGYLSESAFLLSGKPTSLLFLVARRGDIGFASHITGVLGRLQGAVADKIFDFSDGAIVAIGVNDVHEPPKVTVNRTERDLLKLDKFYFVRPSGETYPEERRFNPWREWAGDDDCCGDERD